MIGVIVLVGLIFVALLPLLLAAAEEVFIESHRVEEFFKIIGLHQVLDDLADSIVEMLGLE